MRGVLRNKINETCQRSITAESSISFSPDGNNFVASYWSNTATIWEIVDGRRQEKVTIEHSDWSTDASFSPDGSLLITSSSEPAAKIWMLKNNENRVQNNAPTVENKETIGIRRQISFNPARKIKKLIPRSWKKKFGLIH